MNWSTLKIHDGNVNMAHCKSNSHDLSFYYDVDIDELKKSIESDLGEKSQYANGVIVEREGGGIGYFVFFGNNGILYG